ncbi:hypothetical protein [Sneathiella sp.]|uniref:hypothetical protein n=1 Tax=Sneathiella sp. TaxID=1964365 RepID=UPI0039E3F705
MDFSQTTLAFWSSLLNAAIFLSLIAIPWSVGKFKPFVMLIGVGGLVMLLGFDFYVGVNANDYDLASDLMLLTVLKGVFFFLISFAAEKIFRTFFQRSKEKNTHKEWRDEEMATRYDRNFRGLKNHDDTKK